MFRQADNVTAAFIYLPQSASVIGVLVTVKGRFITFEGAPDVGKTPFNPATNLTL